MWRRRGEEGEEKGRRRGREGEEKVHPFRSKRLQSNLKKYMDARAKRDDERGRREEEMEQRNDESSGYESKIMENGRTKGGEEGDEDLYFEMEFPVQNHQWRAGTICSSSS